MVGVERGTVTFDVKAHAVPFDREVEPMGPDDNVRLRRDAFLQESLVQSELQRTVEAGLAKAKGIMLRGRAGRCRGQGMRRDLRQ